MLNGLRIDGVLLMGWLATALKILGVLVLFVVARRTSGSLISRSFRKATNPRMLDQRKARTLEPLSRNIASYTITFVVVLLVLEILNIRTNGILAMASLLSLAVGFGAQNLVKDVITGFFILFEDQFAVGDAVTVAGVNGVVEEMGLRVTRIRDHDGQLYIIPNGQISQVTNHMGSRMKASVTVTFGKEVPVAVGLSMLGFVCERAAGESGVWIEGPSVTGVCRLGESSYDVEITGRTGPNRQAAAERELRMMVKGALEQQSAPGGC